MIVPVKANPNKPSKVFLFGDESFPSFSTDKSAKTVLGVAKNFTLTDLPVKKGGYVNPPSVLIIDTHRGNDYDLVSHFNLDEKIYGQIGQTLKKYSRFDPITKEKFLNEIRFSKYLGINIFLAPQEFDEYTVKLAKNYFDIIIIVSESIYFRGMREFSEVDKRVLITASRTKVKEYSSERSLIPVLRIGDPRELADRPVKNSSGLFIIHSQDEREQKLTSILEQKIARKLLIQDEKPVRYPDLRMNEKTDGQDVYLAGIAVPIKYPLIMAITIPIAITIATGTLMASFISPVIYLLLGGGVALLSGIITNYKMVDRTERERIGSYLEKVEKCVTPRDLSRLYQIEEPEKRITTYRESETNDQGSGIGAKGFFSESEVFRKIGTLQENWAEYELNPLLSLKFPLMRDISCQETLAFHQAHNALLSAQGSYEEESINLDKLYTIFLEAEKTFLLAESNAVKSKHSTLTEEQRKKVGTAHNLVSIALNEESSPNERINAWRKANDQLEGIIHLPDRAVKGLLEKRGAV